MPSSTRHLAPDTQFPFLDLAGAKGRGMGWAASMVGDSRLERTVDVGSRAALWLAAAKAVSRDAAGLRSLGSAQERSCL